MNLARSKLPETSPHRWNQRIPPRIVNRTDIHKDNGDAKFETA
jgi:hypothetical protein